ncbi:hypothetical protein TYRP_011232 [Tyrophagus putrescentiae]|nr:hypothetical protein TYRP_011232 [Tyrophagus putrescentiae]
MTKTGKTKPRTSGGHKPRSKITNHKSGTGGSKPAKSSSSKKKGPKKSKSAKSSGNQHHHHTHKHTHKHHRHHPHTKTQHRAGPSITSKSNANRTTKQATVASTRDKDSAAHKFVLKGREPPLAADGILSPSRLQADEMTTIYMVPSVHFKTAEEVVRFNDYEVLDQIGKGGFAVVFKARHLKSGQLVACKTVKVDCQDAVIEMKNELFIMEMVDNPFAVRLYMHFLVNEKLYIFMQLADAGSFGKLLEKGGAMDERDAKFYFAQMVCGVGHMHACNIAHRDIKPANFLMAEHQSGKKIVLVSDYGLSRIVHKEGNRPILYTTQCGTPAYMAPEILSGADYNCYLADVWSLGCTLYAMLNLMTPFNVDAEDYGVQAMVDRDWEFSEEVMRDWPPSDGLNSIMEGMLEPDPSRRADMKELAGHKWLAADFEAVQKMTAATGKSVKK